MYLTGHLKQANRCRLTPKCVTNLTDTFFRAFNCSSRLLRCGYFILHSIHCWPSIPITLQHSGEWGRRRGSGALKFSKAQGQLGVTLLVPTLQPSDILHVVNDSRPSLFLAILPLPFILGRYRWLFIQAGQLGTRLASCAMNDSVSTTEFHFITIIPHYIVHIVNLIAHSKSATLN